MKRSKFVIILALAAALTVPPLAALAGNEKAAAGKDKAPAAKDKAAVVNGVTITNAEIDKEVQRFQQQLAARGQNLSAEQITQIRTNVLESLIDRELLYQQSQKEGIKVSSEETEAKVAELKQGFPSEEQFKTVLTNMNLTEAEFKTQLARQLAVKKMIDQDIASKITISEEETKAFYDANANEFKMPEQVHASHILIKVEPNASPEDKAKARKEMVEIQEKVKKGEDFAALAKEYSKCPSAAQGGDLGYFQRGQMVGPFEEAAFALKPGEVSDIVETQFGYHLIKVADHKEASTMPFETIKDKISEHLKQQKVNTEMKAQIDQLKQKADIKTFESKS